MLPGLDPYFFAGLLLESNVEVRGGVVSYQDHSETGDHSPSALEPLDLLFDFFLDFPRNGLAVNDHRHNSSQQVRDSIQEKKFLQRLRYLFAITRSTGDVKSS
jgi:hypothetical protein